MKTYIITSEKNMLKLGSKIAKKLSGGELILLCGDLGSGKSVFARGVINSFGIKDNITSPTFTIVNNYVSKKFDIYHFDMYRLENSEEALAIGADEILDDKNAIKLMEWPERVVDILPQNYIRVDIKKINETTREVDVEVKNEYFSN